MKIMCEWCMCLCVCWWYVSIGGVCVHATKWSTHSLCILSMPPSYVNLEDTVECLQNLLIEDDQLVGVVAHTHLNQCLQNEMH